MDTVTAPPTPTPTKRVDAVRQMFGRGMTRPPPPALEDAEKYGYTVVDVED